MAYISKVLDKGVKYFLVFIIVYELVTVDLSKANHLSINPSLLQRNNGNREKFHIKINDNEEYDSPSKNYIAKSFRRFIRSAEFGSPQSTPFSFNDNHYIAKVHWSGSNSSAILILMTDPDFMLSSLRPSYFYVSRDYGKTFENITKDLILPNGTQAVVTDFFSSSADNKKYILISKFHQYIFQSDDEFISFQRVSVPFIPMEIKYHPRFASNVLAYEKNEGNKMLYSSSNNGKSWSYKSSRVVDYYWSYAPPYDMETYVYYLKERYYDSGGVVLKSRIWGYYSTVVISDVVEFKLIEQYMFVVKNGTDSMHKIMQVSVNRGVFQNASFPIQNASSYIIADASENETMVAISHGKSANLYISGKDGTKFSLSMTNIVYYNDDDGKKSYLEHDFVELYRVEGISGIYIVTKLIGEEAGQRHLQSYITFDKGGEWSLIKAPSNLEKCPTDGCSLHISQEFAFHNPYTRFTPPYSKKSAPGFIIATGNVGESLKSSPSVFFSRDGGISWKKIFDGHYYYAFVDHGGVIACIEKFGTTNILQYSYDEGNTWNVYTFYTTPLRIYGLLTEPGEKSTVFTLFGSLPESHAWIIIQVDMKLVLGNECKKSDYKIWEVSDLRNSTEHCLLGKKQLYERRDPNSRCYNGRNYDRLISSDSCICTRDDFDCDFGYKLEWRGWNQICVPDGDFSNQGTPTWCQPGKFYNSSTGYRKVPGDECTGGVEDQYRPKLYACPIKRATEYLFYTTRNRIYRYDFLTKESVEFDLNEMQNVVSLEVDYQSNILFYADITLDRIVALNMNTGNVSMLLQLNNSRVHIEALTYDWMNGNLYYCDAGLAEIGIINLQGKHKKILVNSTVLDKPRALMLHPKKGIMFWTDWGRNPQIGSANMDGSNPISIIIDDIKWPNGLAIDYDENRLYWADAHTDKIESSDLDGRNRKVVTTDVFHPYSITIFKNYIFWDDWVKRSILKIDKKNSASPEIIIQSVFNGMDVKAFWPEKQAKDTNPCDYANCKFFCLPIGKYPYYRCTCPGNLIDNGNDNCTCPGSEMYENGECKARTTCADNQFKCKNGNCIPIGWKCDKDNDCSDGSDEDKAICGAVECSGDRFLCDGRCLLSSWRCDGENDCIDGSDEKFCTNNCTEDGKHFLCPNKRCIPISWLCDRDNDCPDGSDESSERCSFTTQTPFTQSKVCQLNQFRCTNGNCISFYSRCNGIDDCGDNSDEFNCTITTWQPPIVPLKCEVGQAYCADRTACYEKNTRCDGMYDCKDGSDEWNCKTSMTTSAPCSGYKCNSGECIPQNKVCDKKKDCSSGEDEAKSVCKETLVDTCYPAPFSFNCTINDGSCYPQHKKCDQVVDCGDVSDEDPKVCKVTDRVSNLEYKLDKTSITLKWEHAEVGLKDIDGYRIVYLDEYGKITKINTDVVTSYTVTNLRSCRYYLFAVAVAHNKVKESNWLYTSTDVLKTEGNKEPKGAYDIKIYSSFISWSEDSGRCYLDFEILYKILKCDKLVGEIQVDGTNIKNMDNLLINNGGNSSLTYNCSILIAYETVYGESFNVTSDSFLYKMYGTVIVPSRRQGSQTFFRSKTIIWAIPVALVLIALLSGLIAMVYKYRRLQRSFLAFAARGSYAHQDEFDDDDNMAVGFRSGEDAPMINRFSDDEPLVVG
ncbi:sortilin-related receptor isoform X5 [Hydra vulgaris]|uniref:Sortilin-related receptor n=1 Tax=Hydra vulgaris TaxID=6087 RepID=A0ABM4B4R8_HYDVU